MTVANTDRTWVSYEEVATFLLDRIAEQFELEGVEGKQVVRGNRAGTKWEIDGKGVAKGRQQFVILECRRYTTSRLSQEAIGALAYRILDTGASGGIVVSPLGLQKGAEAVASAERIVSVTLDAGSTTQEYVLKFLNQIRAGVVTDLELQDDVTHTIDPANVDTSDRNNLEI